MGTDDSSKKKGFVKKSNSETIFNKIPDNEIDSQAKKECGNILFKQKDYHGAIKLYTEALNLFPNSAAYGNRAACYMMLGKFTEGLCDARKSTEIDPTFVKGFIRESKCSLALGDIRASQSALTKACNLDSNNAEISVELMNLKSFETNIEMGQKAYQALYYIDTCLNVAKNCNRIKVWKAECLSYLKKYQEAREIVDSVLRNDEKDVDALYVRALCFYYDDNSDMAVAHLRMILKLSPDHDRAKELFNKLKLLRQKKEEGNDYFKKNKFEEAYKIYTEALEIDKDNSCVNAKLYFNRATVNAKLNRLEDTIKDCTSAIDLDSSYLKAYLRRAKAYNDVSQFEECVRDYEKAYQLSPCSEYQGYLQEAKLALKKSKRKDYYKILNVSQNASDEEIKKAYRKRALIHHPDRHSNATEQEKRVQEQLFKEIGEAYAVLSDPKKRRQYDQGQDLDEMPGFDPNTIFQAFFQNSDMFSFTSGTGFSNFPGGFVFQFS